MASELNWLFVDLNSYFASVEQQLQPHLRGKPIAVVPMIADTTFCIAASYPAKAYGVKTGVRVSEAKRLCPNLILVEARHEEYIEFHEAIVEAVESCLPVTAVMSIDEMACRLRGPDCEPENAVALGQSVKKEILKVGSELTSSVGIASNRLLAKIASDMQKPDGLTVLRNADLPQALYPLKLRDIPGVGPKMEIRLHSQGIRTMEELLRLSDSEMKRIWGGIWGKRMHGWLRGQDLDFEFGTHRSIGHSHVLPPDCRNAKDSWTIAQKLLQKTAIRLRKAELWASAMSLGIRFMDGTKWEAGTKMLECQDTLTLLEVLRDLWEQRPPQDPMKVAVTLSKLIPEQERTFLLFDDGKRRRLSQTVDTINSRYGKNTIYFGGIHEKKTAAPTRIAFSQIPKEE